ncbi:MAG: monoheme cytochrome C [Bacteroidia bacterium]|nr:monoheme cytochrome C [Bacteroidia bacterium]
MSDQKQDILNDLLKSSKRLTMLTVSLILVAVILILTLEYEIFKTNDPVVEENELPEFSEDVKDGIHVQSGLIAEGDYKLVYQNCGGCHSHRLVVQNRATAEGWSDIIKWMQESHNLWDLGDNQDKIIEYLSTNYGPESKGRREKLTNVDWYLLE